MSLFNVEQTFIGTGFAEEKNDPIWDKIKNSDQISIDSSRSERRFRKTRE